MAIDTVNTVTTTLNYSDSPADGSRAVQWVSVDPVTKERPTNLKRVEKDVQIENIRGKEDLYNIDNAGFQFIKAKANHTNFSNDEEIKKEYYPESAALLKKLTGANRVIIFDHSEQLSSFCIALEV
jgi:hypothetical protein